MSFLINVLSYVYHTLIVRFFVTTKMNKYAIVMSLLINSLSLSFKDETKGEIYLFLEPSFIE